MRPLSRIFPLAGVILALVAILVVGSPRAGVAAPAVRPAVTELRTHALNPPIASIAPTRAQAPADSLPPVPQGITDLIGKGWVWLIGLLTSALFGALKFASNKLNGLPTWGKAIAYTGLAFIATLITAKTGVVVPSDVVSLPFLGAGTLVVTVLGMGIRAFLKAVGLSKLLDSLRPALSS